MKVLQLVTSANDSFYSHQIRALEVNDIQCTTLTPPGDHAREDANGERSILEYLRFYPRIRAELGDSYDLIHANY